MQWVSVLNIIIIMVFKQKSNYCIVQVTQSKNNSKILALHVPWYLHYIINKLRWDSPCKQLLDRPMTSFVQEIQYFSSSTLLQGRCPNPNLRVKQINFCCLKERWNSEQFHKYRSNKLLDVYDREKQTLITVLWCLNIYGNLYELY